MVPFDGARHLSYSTGLAGASAPAFLISREQKGASILRHPCFTWIYSSLIFSSIISSTSSG